MCAGYAAEFCESRDDTYAGLLGSKLSDLLAQMWRYFDIVCLERSSVCSLNYPFVWKLVWHKSRVYMRSLDIFSRSHYEWQQWCSSGSFPCVHQQSPF